MIRPAEERDLVEIKRIANQNREFIGFVMAVALRESIAKRSLWVLEEGAQLLGFVHYHARRDGWHTLHELAVDKRHQHFGHGKHLLDEVPLPIRLKTTADNKTACAFYEKNGFTAMRTEAGRVRELVVFEKPTALAPMVSYGERGHAGGHERLSAHSFWMAHHGVPDLTDCGHVRIADCSLFARFDVRDPTADA